MKQSTAISCFISLLFIFSNCSDSQQNKFVQTPAFMGAEGFRSFSQAGRNGVVFLMGAMPIASNILGIK